MIPLGILAASGAGVVGSYDLLTSTVLGSDASSVTFSNLNTTYGSEYQHLQIRMTVRRSATSNVANVLRFNGDTGSNYTRHWLRGTGSSVVSGAIAPDTSMFVGSSYGSDATANAFTANIIDILDPFETTKYTTVRTFTGRPTDNLELQSGLWRNTAAISTILIYPDAAGNFVTGSRFSLYGIKAA